MQTQAVKDDQTDAILQFDKMRKQSEKKGEEVRKLKQSFHEQEVLDQESEKKIELLQRDIVQLSKELGIELTEQKEEELCALPPNHHLEEIRKEKEELEKKHLLEVSQLQAALKEKETVEEENKQKADKLRRELKAANERHANDVEELQELKDTTKKYSDEIRELQAALKKKEVNKLCFHPRVSGGFLP